MQQKANKPEEPLLQTSIVKNHPDITHMLISRGTDVNEQNLRGQTALQLAVQQASPNIMLIEALLKNGADPSIADNEGRTAYDYTKDRIISNKMSKAEQTLGGRWINLDSVSLAFEWGETAKADVLRTLETMGEDGKRFQRERQDASTGETIREVRQNVLMGMVNEGKITPKTSFSHTAMIEAGMASARGR